jgi:hypothetical protein
MHAISAKGGIVSRPGDPTWLPEPRHRRVINEIKTRAATSETSAMPRRTSWMVDSAYSRNGC